MIVAITGASGFIGKKLAIRHLALGDQVRFLTRNKESLALIAGAQGYLGDIRFPGENLVSFVQGVDILYHLAAEIKDEKLMWQINVEGTKNLLQLSEGKIGCWIQLSSTGVYGQPRKGIITEGSLLDPQNLYEQSKAKSDKLVTEFCRQKKLAGCLLRPSNVFGAEMSNQSLFQLISMINKGRFFFVGKKGAIVNYIHVDNVVDALIYCAKDLPNSSQEIFSNIVSDYCTIEQMVEVFSKSLGKAPPTLRLPRTLILFIAMIVEKIPRMPLKQSRINAITSQVIYSSEKLYNAMGTQNKTSITDGFKLLVTEWKKSHE